MAQTDTDTRTEYVGDGNDNSPYTGGFPLRTATDFTLVYVTDLDRTTVTKTIVTDYTVSISADFSGFSVTLADPGGGIVPPATGETMQFRLNAAMTHTNDYENFQGAAGSTYDDSFDKGTQKSLTLKEELDRTIKVAVGHPDANLPLTALNLKDNAGNQLRVNTAETAFELFNDPSTGSIPSTHADNVLIKSDGVDTGDYQVTGISVDDSDNVTIPGNVTLPGATDKLVLRGTESTIDISGVTFGLAATIHNDSATDLNLGLHSHNDSGAFIGPILELARSRGTEATETIVADNDVLGRVEFLGFDGVDYAQAGEIRVVIDGTPASNNMPAEMIFAVNAGAGAAVDRFWLAKDGTLQAGSGKETLTSAAGKLLLAALEAGGGSDDDVLTLSSSVWGPATITAFLAADGSAANPPYGFATEASPNGLGIFKSAADTMGLTANGAEVGTIGTTGLSMLPDMDGLTVLGRAKLDSPTTDVMFLSHFDQMAATTYALKQNAAGQTVLNGVGALALSLSDVQFLTFNGTDVGIAGANLAVGVGDLTVTAGDVEVTAGNLGIGGAAVGYKAHILEDTLVTHAALKLENTTVNGQVDFVMENDAGEWRQRLATDEGLRWLEIGGNTVVILDSGAMANSLVAKPTGVVIGGTGITASTILDLSVNTTGALRLPNMTTTQRNALTPAAGMQIYNTTTTQMEGYIAGAWAAM